MKIVKEGFVPERSKAELLLQLQKIMDETVETHRATCAAKEAIDKEKMLLEIEAEESEQIIRDMKVNFENSTHQLRRHINSIYHDSHREVETLRKEWAEQLQSQHNTNK